MRIISGKHKGLKLLEFDADNIRPTLDRAREGIFNKLQFRISGAKVLDLFGGTGAISLEFVSRGASVVTCDNNKNSVNLIKQNFAKAKETPNLKIGDFTEVLKSLKGQKFDIVFLDPPFATNYGIEAIKLVLKYNLLKEDGLIVFEHSSQEKFEYMEQIELLDSKKYGYIAVDYLQVKYD